MTTTGQRIGRAKMALVFGSEDQRRGVLSTAVAQVRRRRKGPRLSFRGAVQFSESTVTHLTDVILPLVDRIMEQLGLPRRWFELSAVNVAAASCHDLATQVSGFSADGPVFLALLSAVLRIPLPDDLVVTGHIASTQGDIAPVQGIAAKLAAAVADRSIQRFLYGSFEQDRSLDILSPSEKESSLAAVMQVHDQVRTKAVNGIDELIEEAFAEESIVLSSLRKGFYPLCRESDADEDPVARAVGFLTEHNDLRFWRLLRQAYATGACERGTQLLEAYACSFLRRRRYPERFGSRLLQLVCAMPPAVRRLVLSYPLLDLRRCIKLAQFAGDNEIADVPILFDAVRGKLPGSGLTPAPPAPVTAAESECELFDTITGQISEQALARTFGVPLDSARASFVLASSTVNSYDEFIGIIESFFAHLQAYTHNETATVGEVESIADKAMKLLNETFRDCGGARAAFAQARDGTEGGIRTVLDAMTQRHKDNLQAQRVEMVLDKVVKGMDWPDRIRFAEGAMKRLGPFLPAEIRGEPPERFADHGPEIARAYLKSVSHMQRLLNAM